MTAPGKTKERERLERWAAQNPRDELALEMFAAWVNCPVDKLPPEMRGHTCPATMAAWSRVADMPAACIAELEAERNEVLNQLDSARHSVDVLEAENARLREEVAALKSPPEEYCAKCGSPKSNHPYRHLFTPRAALGKDRAS